MIIEIVKIQCIVFGHLWTFMVYTALMLFLPMRIYWDRDIVICFKEVLKYPNVNLIIEQIKLKCLCSVKPKDASGTSKIDLNKKIMIN